MKRRLFVVGFLLFVFGLGGYAEQEKIVLSATAQSKNGKLAIVNGKRYSEGEMIGAYKITKISDDCITMDLNGKPVVFYVVKQAKSTRLAPKKEEKKGFVSSVQKFFKAEKKEVSSDSTTATVSSDSNFDSNLKRVLGWFSLLKGRNILAFISVVFGMLLSFVSSIWFLVVAFKEHVLWGVVCLFSGIGNFLFLIVHWEVAKKPFMYSLLSLLLLLMPMFIL